MAAEVPGMRIFTGLEKDAAHQAVTDALRTGRLTRPANCQLCGIVEKLLGHHDDYSKPLTVLWLCRKCHVQRHGVIRRAEKEHLEQKMYAAAHPRIQPSSSQIRLL